MIFFHDSTWIFFSHYKIKMRPQNVQIFHEIILEKRMFQVNQTFFLNKTGRFCLEFKFRTLFTRIGNKLNFRSHLNMVDVMETKMSKWSVILLSKHFIF